MTPRLWQYARMLSSSAARRRGQHHRARAYRARNARDLQYETAQLRAAMGEWEPSASAWRRALANEPHLASGAAYSLRPRRPACGPRSAAFFGASARRGRTPRAGRARDHVGSTAGRWEALRALPADTASATVWEEFGDRAMADERYGLARDALTAAVPVRRTSALALKAATASLRAGAPAEVFTLAPMSDVETDPRERRATISRCSRGARRAGPRCGRRDASDDVRSISPTGQHARMARLSRAHGSARAISSTRAPRSVPAGQDADSSDAAGLIALYEGRLDAARRLLRGTRDQSADMALVLGIVSRVRGDSAPQLGAAFLALAEGDTATAAQRFVDAAQRHPEAALTLPRDRAHVQPDPQAEHRGRLCRRTADRR